MKWPVGKYNGQNIVGFWVKVKVTLDFWTISAGWNWGEPYLFIGPFSIRCGAEYQWRRMQ